jgi:hypothetical protein
VGMFDELQCDYPLPGVGVTTGGFQTKDLECSLSRYTITKDGRLVCDKWHYVTVPEHERDHHGLPLLRRVIDEPSVDQQYHGALNFYGDDGDFTAIFKHGRIVDVIDMCEAPPPTDKPA